MIGDVRWKTKRKISDSSMWEDPGGESADDSEPDRKHLTAGGLQVDRLANRGL